MQTSTQLRDIIISALNHLDHVLPGQAPILDFVHHNTLHGFQHLPFEEALEAFESLTGISAYLPEAQNRGFYRQGRINDRDICAALAKSTTLKPDQPVCTLTTKTLTRGELYQLALLHDFTALTPSQLCWQIDELKALEKTQPDVPETTKQKLFTQGAESKAISDLWRCIISKLGIEQDALHPESILDLAQQQAEDWLAAPDSRQSGTDDRIKDYPQQRSNQAEHALSELFAKVGNSISLRGLVMALSGVDILDQVRPLLIRSCASAMDEGIAPWTLPDRQHGLYAAWRASAVFDANLFLHELADWQQIIANLPEDPVDGIILHLTYLEIPPTFWAGYCQRLALELPGWSGLINWRQHHSNYAKNTEAPLSLSDYLAIRLTLDRLWLNHVCHKLWKIAPKLSTLQHYFSKNLAEFWVRKHLYQGDLPEYITQRAEAAINQAKSEWLQQPDWTQLADLIQGSKHNPVASYKPVPTLYNTAWRLFRLAQHLGLRPDELQSLPQQDLLELLSILDKFTVSERAKIWLTAYEHHYREDFFQAIRANHNRGRWAKRETRPAAQIIFCMDDREEGFRRHIEELNPGIETLGAAGFFGIPMNYQGLDEAKTTPLCPIVVTPTNKVQEEPHHGDASILSRHNKGRKLVFSIANTVHQRLRRHVVLSQIIIDVIAPVTLVSLLAKSLFPQKQHRLLAGIKQRISPTVVTELSINAPNPDKNATLEVPKLGFTDNEQANRVAAFLGNIGLTHGFASLVVLMGHGSISENNPHLAAYDCGACSGRHGGPNARAFAAMANRLIIRQLLVEKGITIPVDTWFLGAEHNTCDEGISWYDLKDVPAKRQPDLLKIQHALQHAQLMSAQERCRRLASAPRNPKPKQALQHIETRACDFSQARPELGHATNASAVIGRRALTQGAFFDRRVFLISYDPTEDHEGNILEGILLAVGPVGAGINLEYYFSTVNNQGLGCGSKVPHNITGLFAVMEGTNSDLRTGLPQQMIEIHEAMRLQILVEAKTSVLERIYSEQESLRELIAGGWVHLSVKDPDSGNIFVFERDAGFVVWQADVKKLPVYANSPECYRDKTLPIPPALIEQPEQVTF
ncbi:MAG: putative inorganic carbon transporter subunit DabA [Methylococcales bacterium]